MSTPRWTVTDDGGIPGYDGSTAKIEINDEDVSNTVLGYTIQHEVGAEATLDLTARVVELNIHGQSQPIWHGLELVPTDALVQELERRGDA